MRQFKYFSIIAVMLTLLLSNISVSPSLYTQNIKIKTIDGKKLDLSTFKGKKVLFVNTASKCGYTPQYKALQSLAEKYKDKLIVVGLPCNQFGGQEPGSEKEIAQFCEKNYGVKFNLTEKIKVKGEEQHPIYQWLTQKKMNGLKDSKVNWNFQKYLIDENGQLIEVFGSSTKPLSKEITDLL